MKHALALGLLALPLMVFAQAKAENAAPGQMCIVKPDGTPGELVPLKKTKVFADIAGISARVTVIQTFSNTSRTPVEAVYTFPLPHDAAVDRMRMQIADRIVEGEIKRREEARQIYDAAKKQGMVAAILDQQRPNIFSQSVANIMPGATVQVEISYVQTIPFKDGEFEFVFPMGVGPRFMVPTDADNRQVNPVTLKPGQRSGTTISVQVVIDAGAPVKDLRSELHKVRTTKGQDSRSYVELLPSDNIPNRDFILRYRPVGEGIATSFVTYRQNGEDGTFCMTVVPPHSVPKDKVVNKEVVFVIDQSGSQSGFPLEKSKELTTKLISELNTGDMFNIVAFSNGAQALWPSSQVVSDGSVRQATSWVNTLQANGGTMFLPAIDLALTGIPTNGLVRMVVFNTDGFISNEAEVITRLMAQDRPVRMFTFGIGNSVNRWLIDAMARQSGGDYEVVTLEADADATVDRFIKRTKSPFLTDISVKVEGAGAYAVTPTKVPDLFDRQPVVIFGRYKTPGPANVTVSGTLASGPWTQTYNISLPAIGDRGSGVQTLWARGQLADLSVKKLRWKNEPGSEDPTELATVLALQHHLMSDYTSFVAVEKRIVNIGGKQRTVDVPVEMPDGVTMGQKDKLFGVPAAPMASGGGAGSFGAAGGALGRSSNAAYDAKSRAGEGIQQKLNPKLKSATGTIEVQIRYSKLDKASRQKLTDLGFKLADEDPSLKVLFGTIKADSLKALAELDFITAVDPL